MWNAHQRDPFERGSIVRRPGVNQLFAFRAQDAEPTDFCVRRGPDFPTGRTPVVGIASGSQGHGGKKPPAAYNLFHIGGEKGRWTLSKERFGLTEDKATFAREHEELLLGG